MADLVDEVTAEAGASFEGGRTNNLSDLSCSIGAIVASFAAAVLAAVGDVPVWITAFFAAMPGLFTALQRVVDFRGRSAWYFVKAAKLRELALVVKWDPNLTQSDGARQFGAILKEMEDRWSEVVKAGPILSSRGTVSGSSPGSGG